jgi:threonine dehydrogenase-like Zn-dependent dehydrogenase
MIALVKYQKGKGNVGAEDVPVPDVGEDDILLKVKAASICGSDIGFFEGKNTAILHPAPAIRAICSFRACGHSRPSGECG